MNEIKVQQQFKYYLWLSVMYATLMVTAQAVAYRLIQVGNFLEPGGIFVFPATFAISDVISEVYGPTLARRTIVVSLFAQAFYSVIPIIVNLLPYPSTWHGVNAYQLIFGSSWLVFISNLAAVLTGMILNTQIIGKTKLIMRGRFFTARSLLSSAIGEFVLTAIIVTIALAPIEGINTGIKLFTNMFVFKFSFSLLAVYPASLLVVLLKRLDKVDVYEETVSLNPFNRLMKPAKKSADVIELFGRR